MTNRELKEQILDALDYVRNMEGVVRDDKIVEYRVNAEYYIRARELTTVSAVE